MSWLKPSLVRDFISTSSSAATWSLICSRPWLFRLTQHLRQVGPNSCDLKAFFGYDILNINWVRFLLRDLIIFGLAGIPAIEPTKKLGLPQGTLSSTHVPRHSYEGRYTELQHKAKWKDEWNPQEILPQPHQFQGCCTAGMLSSMLLTVQRCSKWYLSIIGA